jgi:multimeric flavodoxin WrbA
LKVILDEVRKLSQHIHSQPIWSSSWSSRSSTHRPVVDYSSQILAEGDFKKASRTFRQSPLQQAFESDAEEEVRTDCAETASTVLILYLEGHEHLKRMAQEVSNGVIQVQNTSMGDKNQNPCRTAALLPKVVTYEDASFKDVLSADAIILGSPVYNANVHPDVQSFINTWDISRTEEMQQKVGAVFVTAGGISAGEEAVMMSLLRSLLVFGIICVGGDHWEAAFGASAIVYEDPFGPYHDRHAATNDPFNNTSWFAKQCYETEPVLDGTIPRINGMFLEKAFGLGMRVGKLTVALAK